MIISKAILRQRKFPTFVSSWRSTVQKSPLALQQRQRTLPLSTSDRLYSIWTSSSTSTNVNDQHCSRHCQFQCAGSTRFFSKTANLKQEEKHDEDTFFDRYSLQGEFGQYASEYDESIQNPTEFWAKAASSLHWFQEPQTIVQQNAENPLFYNYFPDGTINTSYNCLDVHVNSGRGDQTALIYDSPVTNTKYKLTYSELLEQVSLFAGALKDELGVVAGDRVVIYMPMIPQAIVAMLACCRIGAIHSVVFGGFAAK